MQLNRENVNKQEILHECPVRQALERISGKWRPSILWIIAQDTHRFQEILHRIPKINRKTLSEQLKRLEQDGLIIRTAYNEVPPRVEYSLSPLGEKLIPALNALAAWSIENLPYE